MIKKLSLQRVQFVAIGQTFDSLYGAALRFRAQHQTRTNQLTVNRYATGTAIASAAPFFGANQAESVTQYIQQSFATLADILNGVAVYCG